ncbi:MAG: c-type cytochrome [Gemmatimonadota bacterium]
MKLVLSCVVLLSLALPAAGTAQIPDRFTNLEVLPTDIARDDLIRRMRGFAIGLGVRCVHCHLGEDSPTLAGVDFASDERPAKRKAREMMRMMAESNARIAAIPELADGALAVECVTCHRGLARPLSLPDTLSRVYAAQGVTATMATLDSLRERYFGRGTYDFGEASLNEVASQLRVGGDPASALVVLRRNQEDHPRSATIQYQMGLNHEALGDIPAARRAYTRALELAPEHGPSAARLRELGGLYPSDVSR